MKIFISMSAAGAEYHLLAYAAKALAKSEELGKMMLALQTMSDRTWQLDVELKDPAFARAYRSVFSDAAHVRRELAALVSAYPKIKVAKISGEAAATIISDYAGHGFYHDVEKLKYYLKDKTPMSTSGEATALPTVLVPRTEYDHRCPHCGELVQEKGVGFDGQSMTHRACGKPIKFASAETPTVVLERPC